VTTFSAERNRIPPGARSSPQPWVWIGTPMNTAVPMKKNKPDYHSNGQGDLQLPRRD
jgi:hypothetical protein